MENTHLRTRIDSQVISPDVQLWVEISWINLNWLILFVCRHINDPPNEDENEVEPVLEAKSINGNFYGKRPVSMYEARQVPRDENRPPITQSLYSVGSSSSGSSTSNQSLPLVEEVTKRTEVVTRRIQELWLAMQDLSKKDSFVPCSERIRVGVAELIAIFPHSMTDDVLKNALRQLNQNTSAIQAESTNLQRALMNSENPANVEIYLQQVRNCAYNLAKATKTLVTQFQQWLDS